jgi:hypothetical protein
MKLDVHRQFHTDGNGNRVVTLEGINVCSRAWQLIMGVSRATFFRYAEAATSGCRARQHGITARRSRGSIQCKPLPL